MLCRYKTMVMQRLIVVAGLCICCASSVFSLPAVQLEKDLNKTSCAKEDLFAVCNLVSNPNKPSLINGTLYFMQEVTPSCLYDFLSIQVEIENVPTNDGTDKHGIHVHRYGDMTGGCESMGGHYNPRNANHGSPWHPVNARHVGDLGNVNQRKDGRIKTRLVDYLASLHGPESIIGRGIVLHALEDDLGLNFSDPGSLKTGNAGGRLACCVIGRTDTVDKSKFSLYG